jgi:hypothetical protein
MDDELRRFERAVDRLAEAMSVPTNSGSQSTITLNAGGVGVWVAVTCCAVMLAGNIALMAMLVSHDRKIDDLQHYLNAIYMVAPSLKPEK